MHYVVETHHRETGKAYQQTDLDLWFRILDRESGEYVMEFHGWVSRHPSDESQVYDQRGVQSVELVDAGDVVMATLANGSTERYPLSSQSAHPRWQVERSRKRVASETDKLEFTITFRVMDREKGEVFREFAGNEIRRSTDGAVDKISGVRAVEITSDGSWMIVHHVDAPSEGIELPSE